MLEWLNLSLRQHQAQTMTFSRLSGINRRRLVERMGPGRNAFPVGKADELATLSFPQIKTPLPGPRASQAIQRDDKFVSPSYTRDYPCVVDHAEGLVITDLDGNTFLDFCAGIAVCATGHCHPEVVAAITDQAQKLIHMSGTDFYYRVQALLAEKLSSLAPGNKQHKVFLTNSGAEAVEAAIKLARYKTDRPQFIAYLGAFHGRTMGALSLTGSKVVQREGFGPLLPNVTHIPYPYCYRCPFGKQVDSCDLECFQHLEDTVLKQIVPASEVAAIFVEPIQGEGGYIVPPAKYLQALQALGKAQDILLVADEVQAGMGRTGKMFASEHFSFEPDILCLAKGIASGLPLGAVVAPGEIMSWPPGAHASTFGGNPVACAASLKTIELLERELMNNATVMGNTLKQGLKRMQQNHACFGDVRGLGLMIGVEIVKDPETRDPDVQTRNRILELAFQKGLILLGCGPNSIRFSPALVVEQAHIDCCLKILEEVLNEVDAEKQRGSD